MDPRRDFGDQGESLAADFLRKKGYQIIERQYQHELGEIDIVCLDQDELVVVEVKTRTNTEFGYPEESVTKAKLRKLVQLTEVYLQEKKKEDHPVRIDVIAIDLARGEPEIEHFIAVDL